MHDQPQRENLPAEQELRHSWLCVIKRRWASFAPTIAAQSRRGSTCSDNPADPYNSVVPRRADDRPPRLGIGGTTTVQPSFCAREPAMLWNGLSIPCFAGLLSARYQRCCGGGACNWQSMRSWRLLLADAGNGWRPAVLWATRRSAVDRRTATMLYASWDRSMSMRRWLTQNRGVHDGLDRAVGYNAGEDRFCCGGAPARREGVGHGCADR
jgi:hypothetical protein